MRTIKLTHEEIDTINIALQYVYDRKLDIARQNRNILGEKVADKIAESARRYIDTQEIFDGERDV